MTRPPSTMTTSRHPGTVAAFTSSVLVGVWALGLPGGMSNAVDQALPRWFSGFYYAGIALFGALGLAALLLRDPDDRVRAERCVWYGVGWPALFYCIAAIASVGAPAGQAAIYAGGISGLATARIIQISVERRRIADDRAVNAPADPAPLGTANERGA